MGKWIWLIAVGIAVLVLQPAICAQEEEWEEVLDIASGKVASLNLAENKLSITDMEGETQEFELDPDLTVVWDDTADEEKELNDLEVDKEIVVEFRVDESGKKMATWIDLVAVEEELPVPVGEEISPEEPVVE